MFSFLNHLQYVLQKPYRGLLKNTTSNFWYKWNKYLWILPFMTKLLLYVLLTPLRFFNALYYNIWVYGLWSVRDNVAEIFNPKMRGMRYKTGCKYFLYWLFGLPIRFIKYIWRSIIQIIEGFLFVLVDTIFPALTMYHGTAKNNAYNITQPGEWKVGRGNYAGSGIYFGMKKLVAEHYAGVDGMMICARVTLGRNYNLTVASPEVKSYIRHNGDGITNWGLEKGITSVEWWRDDENWWEYCLLSKYTGEKLYTWRIRVLYVKDLKTKEITRIWGGKSYWIF